MPENSAFPLPAFDTRSLVNWPQRFPHRQTVAYLCSYAPEELIHAAGFTPIRIRTSPHPPTRAEAHLQSFTCALCRSALDQALRSELDFVRAIVFPHTCDTMQALCDLWAINRPDIPALPFMLPTRLDASTARRYLMAELEQLHRRLEKLVSHPIAPEALRASIHIYNEKRHRLNRLTSQRDRLSNTDFYRLLDLGFVMPVEEYNALLEQALEALSQQPPLAADAPRLVLVGAVLDDPVVLPVLDELGARVVGDDLCTGRRYYSDLVHDDEDPIAALADRYLQRLPCPAKYHAEYPRAGHLLRLVQETQADGVVFLLSKFCDPHAFDYALVKPALESAGVPHLALESEHTPAPGQMRTRLQAFLEMIS